jgi:hypothetical protein
MNESPSEGWFYIRQGERVGPVGLSELRLKAGEGGLDARLDMVWAPGMANWQPAGEIQGLFQPTPEPPRPEPEPEEPATPAASLNGPARDAWFYTREGERCGPVTLPELRVKAAEGLLNPRLDMVWTQGMDGWKPSGEIDGLFEKKAPEEKESLAPKADPYAPPKAELTAYARTRRGLFPKFENREDALKVTKLSSCGLLGFAAVQAGIAVFLSPGALIDAAIIAVLAGILYARKSRVAAVLLLLSSVIIFVAVLLKNFGLIQEGGSNIFGALYMSWCAIRAVQATFYLNGRVPAINPDMLWAGAPENLELAVVAMPERSMEVRGGENPEPTALAVENRSASGASSDSWFYTREGERCGPVTLPELRVKAAEGLLNPRLDMVWTQGMDGWKPSGEIDGLFEKKAPEEKESLAPKADPYAPPSQESVAEAMSREGGWPGARRRTFLLMTILFPFVWSFVLSFAGAMLGQQLGPEITAGVNIAASLVPFIVGIHFGLARLVNLGMSRWWYLGNFVPFLNLWVGYRCFACPAGYAYHKKLDGPGVALAILYWLLVVLTIIVIVGVIALLFGAVNNPEVQDQLREAIRIVRERAVKP